MSIRPNIVYIPLVRANAFIGIEQYNERKRAMYEEAVRLSVESLSKAYTKRTFDELEQDSSPNKKQRLNMEATSSICTLVRCNAVIGMDLLTKNWEESSACRDWSKPIGNDNLPKRKQRLNFEKPSTMKPVESTIYSKQILNDAFILDGSIAVSESDDSTSSTLVRCNAVIGMDLLTKNWEETSYNRDGSFAIIGKDNLRKRKQRLNFEKTSTIKPEESRTFSKRILNEAFILDGSIAVSEQNDSPKQKQRVNMETTSTSGTLVRYNAVIGMDLLTKNWKETSYSREWSFAVIKKDNFAKRKASETYYKRIFNDAFILDGSDSVSSQDQSPKKKRRLSIRTTSKTNPRTKTEESYTLVRCDAVIGMDLLTKNWQSISLNLPKRKQRLNIKKTSTMYYQAKVDEPSPLVRCNAVIGLDLLQNWEQCGEQSNKVSKTPNFTSSSNNKFVTSIALAKSRQKRLTMNHDKLMRMEEAIQEWNAHFGTKYTIL